MLIGKNGILTKATTVEENYNKVEVLEELNIVITEKYLDAYNKASANGRVNYFEEYYSFDKVIEYLCGYSGGEDGLQVYLEGDSPDSKVYITKLNGYVNTDEDTRYFIILNSLGRNISKYGKGYNDYDSSKDYFYIKVSEDANQIKTARVFYKSAKSDSDTDDEEIGILQIQQTL